MWGSAAMRLCGDGLAMVKAAVAVAVVVTAIHTYMDIDTRRENT